MSTTTTLRMPDELKGRVAQAAKQAGTTPHAFMLDAITKSVDQAERQGGFYAEAERRYAEFLETGESIPWDEVRRYLKDRLAGKAVERPVARALDR